MTLSTKAASWIALSIGNSYLHWFSFQGEHLYKTWNTAHMSASVVPSTWQQWQQYSPVFAEFSVPPALWILSVVPSQTVFWQQYPQAKVVTAADIPLPFPYPTFGLDRALSVWVAGRLYQWPILVIDAGTAMTYTGAVSATQCVGGAILPGLGLQLRSLQATPELPPVSLPEQLPHRWPLGTEGAIQSGVVHTLVSGLLGFIQDWLSQYPTSKIVITGGDAPILYRYLTTSCPHSPNLIPGLILNPLLQGAGLLHLRQFHSSLDVDNPS